MPAINKIVDNIKTSAIFNAAVKKIHSAAVSAGKNYNGSKFAGFYEHYLEPVGANNKFPVIAGLMIFVGIMPRFFVAAKRNPDDKEATRDELKEIFFRDAQTAAVLLLLLKTLNAVIAGVATKKTGIPMTNKPFEKLFDSSLSGFKEKMQNFIANPKEKFGIMGRNFLNALNPMGGVEIKSNASHIIDYSNYTFETLPKFMEKIESERGDKKKVMSIIIDGAVEKYESLLKGADKHTSFGIDDYTRAVGCKEGEQLTIPTVSDKLKSAIDALNELKQKDYSEMLDTKDERIKNAITYYLSDTNNSLLKKAKGLNAWLRSVALAFEIGYLGLGIPALNQLRLEKKYLKNNPSADDVDIKSTASDTLAMRNIKEHQIKLYHNFIK